MKQFYILVSFIFTLQLAQAQQFVSPYKLSTQVDIPLAFTSVSFLTGGYLIGTTHKLPPREQLLNLNRTEVNRFDRGATKQNSRIAAYTSDALLYASIALPLAHLANRNSRKDFGKVAAMGAEVFVLNLGVTELVKNAVGRKRPLLYNPEVPIERKWKRDNFKSFFSGHTSTVSAMSFYFAQTYADYNPNSKLKPMVWSISAALPLITGLLRYKAGKHYWTDVIVGYAVGALIGIGVPYLHRTILPMNQ